MKGAPGWAFGLVVVAGAAVFGVWAIERRAARASKTLSRELEEIDRRRASPLRTVHVDEPTNGSTAERLAGLFRPAAGGDRQAVGAILEATRARGGGLPNGLTACTQGPERWSDVESAIPVVVAAVQSPAQCLDALALGRDLAIGGGSSGVLAAHRLTALALEPCARVLDLASLEEKRSAIEALTRLLASAPSVAVAFREADLDRQLRLFGSWMRSEDLARLPTASAALARTGAPAPRDLLQRQRQLGTWTRMTRNARKAVEALDLPASQREARLLELEASYADDSIGLKADWRALLGGHEERLAMLSLLRLATRLDAGRAQQGVWPSPSPVEAAGVDIVPSSDTLYVRMRGTTSSLTVRAD